MNDQIITELHITPQRISYQPSIRGSYTWPIKTGLYIRSKHSQQISAYYAISFLWMAPLDPSQQLI